jgi:quercetin dioxygenase-like cupin family protein
VQRLNIHRIIAATIISALLALGALGGVIAQEAPAATPDVGPSRTLASVEVTELPPPPAFIRLVRIVMEPGAGVPLHSHPGPEIGVVEQGVLTVETGGAVAAASAGEPSAVIPVPESGATFTLSQGDQIVYPAGVPFGFRNEGDRPVSVLAAVILPAGEGRPPGAEWFNGAPGADAMQGVSSLILGDAAVPGWPTAPFTLQLDSLDLEPGTSLPGWPGPVMIAVERGQLGFALLGGEFQVSRNGEVPEAVTATGKETTIEEGDAVFFPGGMNDLPRDDNAPVLSVVRFGIANVAADPAPPAASPVAAAADATPEASGIGDNRRVMVAENGVRLREAPSTDGAVVAELARGVLLTVTGEAVEGDGFAWFPVALADDPDTSGFIAEPYLQPAP